MDKFSDKDDEYREWVRLNPSGYVLNMYRNLSPSYAKLHKVDCRFIQNYLDESPTVDYTKWCSVEKQELVDQARLLGATPEESSCCC